MNFNKSRAVLLCGCVILIASCLISLGIGALSLPIEQVVYALLTPVCTNLDISAQTQSVVLNVRLPRILTAIVCGAGLAASGAAFQALFSNPLATADTLGVSTGAAFGAVLGILFGFDAFGVQTLSLIVGLAAVFGVWQLSLIHGKSSILMLILSGLVVAALFSSLISLVKFAADPQDELPAVTFWLMGSLTGADWKSLKLGLPFVVIGSLVIWALRWKLNALSLSEDEAKSLGLPVSRLRLIIVTAATAVTAASVSMCGFDRLDWSVDSAFCTSRLRKRQPNGGAGKLPFRRSFSAGLRHYRTVHRTNGNSRFRAHQPRRRTNLFDLASTQKHFSLMGGKCVTFR